MSWPGLASILAFYLLILGIGALGTIIKKSWKGTSEDVMLADHDIGLVVGIFTMTGIVIQVYVYRHMYRGLVQQCQIVLCCHLSQTLNTYPDTDPRDRHTSRINIETNLEIEVECRFLFALNHLHRLSNYHLNQKKRLNSIRF